MSRKPKPEFVVEALMTKRDDAFKILPSRGERECTPTNVRCLVYVCPRNENGKNTPSVVTFKKGSGWRNRYAHLLSCVSGGDEQTLLQIYQDSISNNAIREGGARISSFFASSLSATAREKAMYAYLDVIISLSLPISYVENARFRHFSGINDVVSVKAFRETVFKLVELVEFAVRQELKETSGAVMHDGWTHNGTHYLGVCAVFMKKVERVESGKTIVEEELSMPLLSLSPIAIRDEGGDIESARTISFDADTHIRQLEHIFHYFHVNVHEWSVCQIGDSCALNKTIASKMGIPHVGCYNHKLALDVNKMTASPMLKRTLESVRTTMRECKGSIKNRAMLHRLSTLVPIVPCATRWSGLSAMMNRFVRIRPQIEEVADTPGLDLTMTRTFGFERQCNKQAMQLKEINTVTKDIQKRGATLEECRFMLDTLFDTISFQKDNVNAPLYDCKLKNSHTKLHSIHSPSSVFESGVVKIQQGDVELMNDEERAACAHLKVTTPSSSEYSEGEDYSTSSMSTIFEKRKRRRQEPSQAYMNLSIILGSSAEMERLLSVAGGILLSNRHRITPMLFEALLFLKVNRSYWDLRTVVTAISNARSARVTEQVEEDADEQHLLAL